MAVAVHGHDEEVWLPTRKDVARLAGVSEATVSYTLSGKRTISRATQERVRQAMAELGYQPHALATALAGGSSPIIAVLFPVIERGISNADMEYVLGAAAAARSVGHHVLLWPTTSHDIDDVVAFHQSGLIGGVVLMEVLLDDTRVSTLTEAGVPVALIGRTRHDSDDIPFVDRDFAAAADIAVAHLAELGHSRIWFVSGPKRLIDRGFGAPVRAEEGFRRSCRAHGVQGVVKHAEAVPSEGARLARSLQKAAQPPTAVVSLNVEATLGLFQAAPHAGLRIPDDVSVVSIGTPEPWAESTEPQLTAISAPAAEMGATAVHQLISRIAGEPDGGTAHLFTGTFAVRASTSSPPTG